MAKKTDSNLYTILFSIGMVIIVGSLLAFFASFTKDSRENNDKVKAQVDILSSIGIEANRSNATEKFTENIKKQYVIEGTNATENLEAYLIDIKKEQAKAKNGEIQRLPLFIAEKEGKTIYIVPIRGIGLWGPMWGYVGLKDDLETIEGVFFDHQSETPGLGSNITQSYFTDDFKGEKIYDIKGNYAGVAVSKSNNDPLNNDKTDNEVDAIGGATITGNGVAAMLKSGIKAYLPYFKTLKK
ncbi:MAG: NADH:ubiquinone reductase (Na(+)-transporting) subunit C [Flavobacteriales bacterium]